MHRPTDGLDRTRNKTFSAAGTGMDERELIIIGGGPAGCSAAVYAARSRIDTLIMTEDFGGQLLLTDSVENYLGFESETGPGLSEKYQEHVESYEDNVDIRNTTVDTVEQDGDRFLVHHGDETTAAKAVIVACGTTARKLGVPGEEEFNNRGVGYCAVCDGPLYSDEDVAIIGGGYSGTEAAVFLSSIASSVTMVNYGDELSGEPITIEQIPELDNVEVIHRADTKEFYGSMNSENSLDRANSGSSPSDDMLEGLRYEDRDTGEQHELEVAAAFIEIGRTPNSDLVDFVEKDDSGRIVTDNHAQTSVDGLFAAGDVADIEEEQAIVAAGDGCKAALQVDRYLKEVAE